MKNVVIIGGGFAGLNAAKVLGQAGSVRVTLIDRRNHHLFQPLLYQVAMAGLSPADIAAPIRTILSSYEDVEVFLDEITDVHLAAKTIVGKYCGPLPYDYLIMACGAQHAYFGHEDWEEYAPGLKTLEQATEIRRRVLNAFEAAEREKEPEQKQSLLTFVVIGGGPTGVELAGALGEMCQHTLTRNFRHIDPKMSRIILLEAAPRILTAFDEKLSASAAKDLQELGIEVRTGTMVTGVGKYGVEIDNRETIPSATVVWAAGVQAASIGATLGVGQDRQGRVHVRPDLSISGYPEVFVVGDQANFPDSDGNPLPGLAPIALQQGRWCAANILRDIRGEERQPFSYWDKGHMATIGRSKAIGEVRKIRFTGFVAWLAWLLVHIYYLTGFRNRLFVVLQWGWSYLTFGRGARLITLKGWRSYGNDR